MGERRIIVALYVQLPVEKVDEGIRLGVKAEMDDGTWLSEGVIWQEPDIDLEAMGRELMRKYVRLARHNLGGS